MISSVDLCAVSVNDEARQSHSRLMQMTPLRASDPLSSTESAPRVQQLPLDPEAVPDALGRRVHRLARAQVDADDVAVLGFRLQRDEAVLHVKAGVGEQRLGRHEQRVGEHLDAVLGPTLGLAIDRPAVVRRARQLERAGAGDDAAVLERVLDRTQAVPDRVVDLRDRVRVGACAISRGPK